MPLITVRHKSGSLHRTTIDSNNHLANAYGWIWMGITYLTIALSHLHRARFHRLNHLRALSPVRHITHVHHTCLPIYSSVFHSPNPTNIQTGSAIIRKSHHHPLYMFAIFPQHSCGIHFRRSGFEPQQEVKHPYGSWLTHTRVSPIFFLQEKKKHKYKYTTISQRSFHWQ